MMKTVDFFFHETATTERRTDGFHTSAKTRRFISSDHNNADHSASLLKRNML